MLPDVDPVIPLLHRGLALQKDGKLPAAEQVYRQALGLVPGHPLREVPDPWFGGPEGFEEVFAMLDAATDRLLDELGHGR